MILLAGSCTVLWLTRDPNPEVIYPPAILTIVPGSTSTPVVPTNTPLIADESGDISPTLLPGEIGYGSFVQIVGTEGDGLNVREDPGLSSQIRFLGYDSEVFEVRDGPVFRDEFTWWLLVTPVDNERQGWAAATFLSVVVNP